MRYLKTYESFISLSKNKYPPTVDELTKEKDDLEMVEEEQEKRKIKQDSTDDRLINGCLPTFPHNKIKE